MAVNQVTAANLQQGIDIVFRRLKQRRGSKGIWLFHNDLYSKMEEYRSSGIDTRCWSFLMDSLAQWKAIRGTADHTKESIREKGLHLLPILRERFNNLVGQQLILPTIENITWKDIEPLFLVAKDIKGVEGPMFASKLCHFLLPSAFFVFDNTLVKRGWANYQQYWEDCRTAWMAVGDDSEHLKRLLKNNMPSHCTPCVTYPWPTKITELCQFETKC